VIFYAGVDPFSIEKIMHIVDFDYLCLGLYALYRENSFNKMPIYLVRSSVAKIAGSLKC